MAKYEFKVDKEKCIHCGKCVSDCSANAIELDENKTPQMVNNNCFNCQHCFCVCPTGAISICGRDPQKSDAVWTQNPDAVLNLIKSRRSIRHFKQENLPQETLDKLKDMLDYVPTGCNNHGLYFSFVEDIKVMDEYREFLIQKMQGLAKQVPGGIIKKFARYRDKILAGEDVIFRNAPNMVVVSVPKDAPCADIDPTIALSYLELYAQSLGVGTLWCGLAKICFELFPELHESLNLPEGYKLAYVMLLGPSDIRYTRTSQPLAYQKETIQSGAIQKLPLWKTVMSFFGSRK